MSLNSNSSFVCVICSFFIYVNGIPLIDVSKQTKSIEAAELRSTNQISEILYEIMTLEDLKTEKKITQESFCNSVLRALTTSQLTKSFKSATIKVQDFIGNLNQDTRQIITNNIFTTLQSCSKKETAENDLPSLQKESKDTIFENNEGSFSKESKIIRKLSDLSMNLDVHPESQSEKNNLGSGHELVPREAGEINTNFPMLNRDLGILPETNDKTKFENQDNVYFHSKNGASSKSFETLNGRVKNFFLFNDRMRKPVIDKDLSSKIFLFGRNDRMGQTKTNEDGTGYGSKSLYTFDDDIAKLLLSRKTGRQ